MTTSFTVVHRLSSHRSLTSLGAWFYKSIWFKKKIEFSWVLFVHFIFLFFSLCGEYLKQKVN